MKNLIRYSTCNRALILAFFLNFLGFYCVLLLFANLNLLAFSRYITVPLRLLIILCLCFAFLRSEKLSLYYSSLFFLVFSLLYFLRIFVDFFLDRQFYTSYQQVFFYYLTFGFVPFILVRHMQITPKTLNQMKKWFLVSGFIFSLLATIIYAKFIGQVGRLTSGASENDLISPLILSYCSALVIGICMNMLLTNRLSRGRKFATLILIVLSLTPFFLGASRGSIFAIALPILFIIITNKRFITNLKVFISSIIAFILLVLISDYFGSNIFNRFISIFSDVSSNSTSGERVLIWKQSLSQFFANPIFGDRMEVVGYNIYPHNLFIEVLQNVGLLGALPFFCLVAIGLKECFLLFRNHRSYSWIGVFFLQALAQNTFSGAIYNASWFWFSLALVISVRLSLKFFKNRRLDELSTSL